MNLSRSFTVFLGFFQAASTGVAAQVGDSHSHLRTAVESQANEAQYALHEPEYTLFGIPEPTEEAMARRHALIDDFVDRRELSGERKIIVPLCFHVLADDADWILGGVRDRLEFVTKHNHFLQDQLDNLNAVFSYDGCCDLELPWCQELQNRGLYEAACSVDTRIQFQMALVDSQGELTGRTTRAVARRRTCKSIIRNTEWHNAVLYDDAITIETMMMNLHRGDASVLNVYFKKLGPIIGGLGTFPWMKLEYPSYPPSLDGIIISTDDGYTPYEIEKTLLAHEAGHWLGLYHTFKQRCDDHSDWTLDTFPGRRTIGCPINSTLPDRCPGDDFPDPFMNIMSYGGDECRYQITPDQKTIMRATWYRLRATDLQLPDSDTIELENGVPADPVTLVRLESQLFLYDLLDGTTASSISCRSSHIDESTGLPCVENCVNGATDLSLRWNEAPTVDDYDCRTNATATNDTCTVELAPTSETLYVELKATAYHGLDVIVTCVED